VTRMRDPIVSADLDSIGVHNSPELLGLMMMGPDEVARYLASTPNQELNTDDNAYLEYHTPFDMLQKWQKIVAGMVPFAALDLQDVRNISPEERAQVSQAWERRKIELLQELKGTRTLNQAAK